MAKESGSGLNFSPFSSEPSPASAPVDPLVEKKDDEPARVQNNNPRTTSYVFDQEALERSAKALREIAASAEAKKAFELLKKHEKTRQALSETEKERVIYDKKEKLAQQQAQIKSLMARYADELARKRMQAENDKQRK